MTFVLVQATRDRAAVGRRIIAGLAGAAVGGGLLVSSLERRVVAPTVKPPLVVEDSGGRRLVIPSDANGSCYVAARVNGALFDHMLIDTGASGRLVFGRNHAARLGFDPATLAYSESYGSANGVGQEAIIRVREFRLGSFVLRDVPAAITAAPQDAPLLNVEILHRLDLRLSGGYCELRLP